MKKKNYINYHKHTKYSSAILPDTHIQLSAYFDRAMELEHKEVFTTEHGFGGSIFNALELKEEYKNKYNYDFKIVYAMEIYMQNEDGKPYHLIVIARTENARKMMNKLNSIANEYNYFNKRGLWKVDDVLSLPSNEVYITSACMAGLLKDYNGIAVAVKFYNHFRDNFFLEVQNHNHTSQMEINKTAISLSEEYGIKIIHANDSHYIYPEQAKDRAEWLSGKGLNYGDEDSFILDYPDYETIVARYKKQGVLTDKQIENSLENTLLLNNIEEYNINKSIKMPSIYPELSDEEKMSKFDNLIKTNFDRIKFEENINDEEAKQYYEELAKERQIIVDTKKVGSVDYFLLGQKVVEIAVEEEGGILTSTGRGSNVAFLTNKVLGLTQVDRLRIDIPIYKERFMSKVRLLETESMPDNDFDTADAKPFIKATKRLMGEHGCYYMLAYGTMQESEAFRNYCRANETRLNLNFEEINIVAKDLDKYRDTEKWKNILEQSNKYIGSIDSISPHPCANLIMDKDIREEVGLIRIKDELCACITSDEADTWKYLKNDYLVVTCWKIIDKFFKRIGEPIPSLYKFINNLLTKEVFDLYADGLTATLNQVDGDWASGLVQEYKPTSIRELAMFTACIRPSFAGYRDGFIAREDFTNNVSQIDELFAPTDKYIIFQENLMQFLEYFGVPADETISVIKKISKKKMTKEEFDEREKSLRKNWIEKIGNDYDFKDTWKKIQSMASYGFNSPHATCYALNSLIQAYCKSYKPLYYNEVILDIYSSNLEKTNIIIEEMKAFDINIKPIEFGKSTSQYMADEKENAIYKGVNSIKYMNAIVPAILYELSHNTRFNTFLDLLYEIDENTDGINSRHIKILIGLNYFHKFGKNEYLFKIYELFENLNGKKILNDANITKFGLDKNIVLVYTNKKTEKQYRELDIKKTMKKHIEKFEDKDINLVDQLNHELAYLGYLKYTNKEISTKFFYIYDFKEYGKIQPPYITLYNINRGISLKCRVSSKNNFNHCSFKEGDLLYLNDVRNQISKPNYGKRYVLKSWEVIGQNGK